MRSLGTRHRQRATGVFQTVVRFVFDRFFGGFLLHARLKAAALNHETVDNTVENRVVVETFAAVVQEVFDCFRRFVVEGFDDDVAVISVESNHFCILFRLEWCFSPPVGGI